MYVVVGISIESEACGTTAKRLRHVWNDDSETKNGHGEALPFFS